MTNLIKIRCIACKEPFDSVRQVLDHIATCVVENEQQYFDNFMVHVNRNHKLDHGYKHKEKHHQ